MSSYIYTVLAPTKSIKQLPTNEIVNIRLAKFFCRNTSLEDKTIDSINLRYLKKGIASHIVLGDNLKDLNGQTVFEYNSNEGLFNDDHDLNNKFKAVGVILGKSRSWYVETRKDVIEKIHRQNEYQKMRRGVLSIGEFGQDYNAYEEYLHGKDKEAQANGQGIYFRGYFI